MKSVTPITGRIAARDDLWAAAAGQPWCTDHPRSVTVSGASPWAPLSVRTMLEHQRLNGVLDLVWSRPGEFQPRRPSRSVHRRQPTSRSLSLPRTSSGIRAAQGTRLVCWVQGPAPLQHGRALPLPAPELPTSRWAAPARHLPRSMTPPTWSAATCCLWIRNAAGLWRRPGRAVGTGRQATWTEEVVKVKDRTATGRATSPRWMPAIKRGHDDERLGAHPRTSAKRARPHTRDGTEADGRVTRAGSKSLASPVIDVVQHNPSPSWRWRSSGHESGADPDLAALGVRGRPAAQPDEAETTRGPIPAAGARTGAPDPGRAGPVPRACVRRSWW